MKRTIKIPSKLTRAGTAQIEDDGSIRLSISSEEPYRRYDWMNDEEYYEVLDHGSRGMDLTRLKAGTALLFNHDRNIQLGTISEPTCEGGRCYVKAKISDAPDVESYRVKIREGILKDTSVGYSITDEGTRVGERDGIPVYRFKWAPFEASLVTVPADISVGVGRQRDASATEFQEISVEDEKSFDKQPPQPTNANSLQQATTQKAMSDTVISPAAPTIDLDTERNAAIAAFKERCKKIDQFVDSVKNPQWKEAARAVAAKHKDGEAIFDDFRAEALNSFDGVTRVSATETGDIGMTPKEVKRFSFVKAIRDMAEHGRLTGLEKEACDTARKVLGRELSNSRAFILPREVDHAQLRELTRGQEATTGSAGGALVGTQYGPMIELLRNRTALGQLGITIVDGLVGDFVLPVQTGGCTAYWVSETGTLTDSEATFGQKAMTPHRLGATVLLSNQFYTQSSISVDAWVRNELDTVLALKKDLAGLHGTGTAGEPIGIANTTGINATVTYSNAATWSDVVEHETGIAVDNADIGSMGFALSAATVGKWKTILKDSVAGAGYLLSDNMTANGYSVVRTNQISGNVSFFGVWSQFLHGMWAGREIIVNPYTTDTSGQVRVTIQELCDNLVRQPLAFNVSTDSAAQ